MSDLTRRAVSADTPFLWKCLAIAAQESDETDAAAIPAVAKYLNGWMRPGDFGVIVEVAGRPLGAV